MQDRPFYWQTEELIVIGLFTALSKVSSLIISLLGGGPNPITLMLKNGIATALLIVMVARVCKFGTLALYTLVGQMITFLIAGGSLISLLPGFLLGAIISDGLIAIMGGYTKMRAVVCGVLFYDLFGRMLSLSFSYLTVRENPALFIFGAAVVLLGYLGCLFIGVPCGVKFVKELRHAGIIREI